MAEAMEIDPPAVPPPTVVSCGRMVSQRLQDGLRECQKKALNDLVRWFNKMDDHYAADKSRRSESTAVVTMPTGSGKTGVICSLPYWFGNEINSNRSLLDIDLHRPILVIAPGLEIMKQLKCDLIQTDSENKSCFLVNVGAIKNKQYEIRNYLYKVKVTESTQDVRNLRCCQDDIVLTNAQKWHKQPVDGPTWRDLDDSLFSIIIVDEAHHLPAPQWKDIISKFQDHAKVIFFTATPYRTDGKPITDSITTFGFAHQLKDSVAVRDGIIRDIHFHDNLIKFEIDERRPYDSKSPFHDQYIEAVVNKVIDCTLSKDKICPLPAQGPHCAMLIAASKQDAEEIATLCREKAPDLVVEHIHSSMPQREYKAVMKKINNNEVRILVIVKKLLEGFDYPRVSVAGIVTRIRSPLVFAQFVGRARRVIRGEENVVADIITHEYFEQQRLHDDFRSGHLIRTVNDRPAEADD